MSARQPFVPSRPASRAAASAGQEDALGLPKPAPLRPQSASGGRPTSEQEGTASIITEQYGIRATVATTDGSNVNALITSVNKPLNISGLMQKKSNRSPHLANHALPGLNSRKSFSANDENSHSPVLNSTAQRTPHIASSSAAVGRPASPFPLSNFKAPAFPSSRLATGTRNMTSISDRSPVGQSGSGNAHTSHPVAAPGTNALDTGDNIPSSLERSAHSPSPFSPLGMFCPPDLSVPPTNFHPMKSFGIPTLEKIHENAEVWADQSLDRSGPVSLDEHTEPILRRVQKRSRAHEVSDDDYGVELEAKRWRASPAGDAQRDIASRGSTGSRRPTPLSHPGYQTAATVIDVDERANDLQTNRGNAYSTGSGGPSRPMECGGGIVHRLFGLEPYASVDEYLGAYEAAKRRWTECTLEEWQTGADEMMSKFGEVMDFVKDHLRAKTSLYTSLHSKVEEHKAVLGSREKVLKDVRESLVRQSGNVVGSGVVLGG
ncbi:hypothetical protein GLOTRDRAFT_130552 [Gloeophyllum trabeum ATCC 11539]|uniref:Extracellular mutant protein 11 C-terminal domain-containing protein n=1 Tax=Gloeophyllum trabeum (strain ATCC 11539 / FP-39264 / Madison 617) TaxID=670483 RepID=S7Q2D4_GLOTA|nr:uncharacterized protein GLOTRDRAFT_130552 [Gloeophyllum trabeum ATCC 11539]EPQ54166.1 hypothetical protein GLOTRDRAFT_130552 [Gloeophyllum trabeum ATCC 11539]